MGEVARKESSFEAADGTRLFRRSWEPAGAVRAKIALVHGYAEHSGRYDWVGEQLAMAGFGVYAYDLRGHGQSEGQPALVRSFKEHLDDLGRFLSAIDEEAPGHPPFLFGHSMGGIIASLYTIVREPELKGLVLSGPAIAKPPLKVRLLAPFIGIVSKVLPRLGTINLPASAISRDPEVAAGYASDPLVFRGRMPAATAAAARRAVNRIHKDMENIMGPLLVLQGEADALCPPSGSIALHDAALSSDKTLKLYEGLYHEVLNEPEKDEVMADLRQWLESRS